MTTAHAMYPTVYLAAPFTHKKEAKEVRAKLEGIGMKVVAEWLDSPSTLTNDDLTNPVYADEFQQMAIQDVTGINSADCLVILNLEKSEGKATEMGLAYATGRPIIVVGERSRNVFYFLPGVIQCKTVEDCLELFQAVAKERADMLKELIQVNGEPELVDPLSVVTDTTVLGVQ